MSRMAEPFACQQKTISSVILLTISLCLLAHFLLEDVSLQQAIQPSGASHSAAGLVFDEVEHQDDLVLVDSLPESIPHLEPPAIPAWNVQQLRQWAVPIRIPPKIA